MGQLFFGGRAVASAPERSERSDRLPFLARVAVGDADRVGRLAVRRPNHGLAHRLLGRHPDCRDERLALLPGALWEHDHGRVHALEPVYGVEHAREDRFQIDAYGELGELAGKASLLARRLERTDELARFRPLDGLDGRHWRLAPERDDHDDGERQCDDHGAEGKADGYPGGAIVAEEQLSPSVPVGRPGGQGSVTISPWKPRSSVFRQGEPTDPP